MFRSALIAAFAFAVPTMAADEAPTSASRSEAAAAEPAPPQPAADEAPRDRIVVRGRRSDGLNLHDYAEEFVLQIGKPASPNHPLARWRDAVCVRVANLPEDAAQFIADQVSQVALDVGLEAGGLGCMANIQVLFAADGADAAQAMLAEHPDAIAPLGGAPGTIQGATALANFTTSDRAVRWWQTTAVLDRYGYLVVEDLAQGRATRPVEHDLATRIRVPPSSKFLTTHIIVDATQLEGVSWRQLADYLAMVALVQVDPDAIAVGYDSILNLFNAESAPAEMTDWDRSFLRSLYSLDDNLHPNTQRDRIADMMTRGDDD